mmetsp:Transcript_32897/g.71787  ORF Transcript_32897/g.71787 Transcript_32897/m.71787 type:complete len:684 (-) Transcript_32897:87-2138(-)
MPPIRLGKDTQSEAAEEVKDFLVGAEGSALKAWLTHFDHNNDQKISLNEFVRGMRRVGYQGDITQVFKVLDIDNSGELSLEEIDASSAILWRRFVAWCVAHFEGIHAMIWQISSAAQTKRGQSLTSSQVRATSEQLSMAEFCEGLVHMGWDGLMEEVLFRSLDRDNEGVITAMHLKWLEIEIRRQQRKEQAKRKALQENQRRVHDWKVAHVLMMDFRSFLKRKYGHFLRAWRCALSPDGLMTLHKNDLFKAVSNIGWLGDVRLLWTAFDKDDSGYISLEELDPRGAEILAHFRLFVEEKFGSASIAFRALDKFNIKKLRQPEFVGGLKGHGFQHPAKKLFFGLDTHGNKAIVEEDILFLDRWRPPAFLTARPNQEAADEVKQLLLKNYKNYVKAWRHVLDTDSSNRVNWAEFEEACRKVNFKGDVPGAWRALDDDLSGFITLSEIDPVSSDTLMNFRRWADAEFGSVKSAFGVFDTDGSNEVTYREFRRACRIYGFEGNAQTLFYALDIERNGALSLEEVMFLDEWELEDDLSESATVELPSLPSQMLSQWTVSDTTEYVSDGPGPAAYKVPSTVGAGPSTPMVHFSGAYSFRRRPVTQLPGINKDAAFLPSPALYDHQSSRDCIRPKKPSWGFGTEERFSRSADSKHPGPGHYSPTRRKGPVASCTPRRPMRVHPLYRARAA